MEGREDERRTVIRGKGREEERRNVEDGTLNEVQEVLGRGWASNEGVTEGNICCDEGNDDGAGRKGEMVGRGELSDVKRETGR